MTDPHRAARLGLAVAIATLWLLSVGGTAEEEIPVSTLPTLPPPLWPPHRPRRATRLRLISVFRQGWLLRRLAALLNHPSLPLGHFVPEPWPQAVQDHSRIGTGAMLLAA